MAAVRKWLQKKDNNSRMDAIIFSFYKDEDEQLYLARWDSFFAKRRPRQILSHSSADMATSAYPARNQYSLDTLIAYNQQPALQAPHHW